MGGSVHAFGEVVKHPFGNICSIPRLTTERLFVHTA